MLHKDHLKIVNSACSAISPVHLVAEAGKAAFKLTFDRERSRFARSTLAGCCVAPAPPHLCMLNHCLLRELRDLSGELFAPKHASPLANTR